MGDETLRDMWLRGDTCHEIGKAIGCRPQTVSKRAHALGLPRRMIAQGALPAAWIVARYLDGMTTMQIANALRPRFPTLARTTVATVLRSRGVRLRPARIATRVAPEVCVRLLRTGYSRKEIAAKVGLTSSQVNYRIAKIIGRLPHGGQNPRRFDYEHIKRLAKANYTHRTIAAMVGCSRQTVGKAIRNRKVA